LRINHKNKLIGVSIPKSGSHTMFKLMEESFGAVKHGSFHGVEAPENCIDYSAFAFVRNPYERAVSIYHMLANPGNGSDLMRLINHEYYKQEVKDLEFETFCAWLGNCPEESMVYEASTSQYDHLRDSNITTIHTIKIDDKPLRELNKFLTNAGLFSIYKLPEENFGNHNYYELSYHTQRCWDLINEWAKKDFKEYKYALRNNGN